MKVWKFFGISSRQALRQVKDALGPDAVILSNRAVEGGIEMAAVAGGEFAALTAEALRNESTEALAGGESRAADRGGATYEREEALAEPARAREAGAAKKPGRKPRRAKANAREQSRSAASAGDADERVRWAQELTSSVIREIQSMRGRLESQLALLAMRDGHALASGRSRVLKRMLAAGFSAALAREALADAPENCTEEEAAKCARTALGSRLAVARAEEEIVTQGGVYALIGPTGVGKTTTTAKIAARCVVRHGAEKIALLTTDSYRIGAHEQLRIYGRILGVPVHTVRDGSDLRTTLAELRNKHTVLIDTMGMSQRDQMVAEQAAMLCEGGSQVKRLLLLNATCHGDTLDDVVRAYGEKGVDGCIITKADEAASLGSVVDVAMRAQLTVHYVADGQRVPEDLHPAVRDDLLERVFAVDLASAKSALEDEGLLHVFAPAGELRVAAQRAA